MKEIFEEAKRQEEQKKDKILESFAAAERRQELLYSRMQILQTTPADQVDESDAPTEAMDAKESNSHVADEGVPLKTATTEGDVELDPASRGRGARGGAKRRRAEGRAAPAGEGVRRQR